ncbi:MAG: hypothetical protein ACJ8LG_14465 [Massilia sp.]
MADPFEGSDNTIISFTKFGLLIDSINDRTGSTFADDLASGAWSLRLASLPASASAGGRCGWMTGW